MPKSNLANAALAARIVQARAAAGFATPEAAAIRLGMGAAVYRRHETGEAAVKPVGLKLRQRVRRVARMAADGIGAGPKKG